MQIFSFILLFFISLFSPLLFFVIAASAYMVFIGGWIEILFLAFFIDAQFAVMQHSFQYFYTLSAGALVLFIMYIRPHLIFHGNTK